MTDGFVRTPEEQTEEKETTRLFQGSDTFLLTLATGSKTIKGDKTASINV